MVVIESNRITVETDIFDDKDFKARSWIEQDMVIVNRINYVEIEEKLNDDEV